MIPFLVGEFFTFCLSTFIQFLGKAHDQLSYIRRSKDLADVINPLRVFFCSLIPDFELVFNRAIGNDNGFLFIACAFTCSMLLPSYASTGRN